MTTTQTTTTHQTLAAALTGSGAFIEETARTSALRGSSARWFLSLDETVRVVLDAEEGIEVYAFTATRARLCTWQARFAASTPPAVVLAALDAVNVLDAPGA